MNKTVNSIQYKKLVTSPVIPSLNKKTDLPVVHDAKCDHLTRNIKKNI